MTKHKNPLRRIVLASLALLAFAGPAMASGCGAGFAPISDVDGTLRVLAVAADKPYAKPGDTVTFTMTYADPAGSAEPPEIVWFGTCTNPTGDDYFGCYPELLPAFAAFSAGAPLPQGFSLGGGPTYTITLNQPDLLDGETEATAFVFFAACVCDDRPPCSIKPLSGLLDGGLASIASSGGGLAGTFPLACYDADMHQLPAANFVPGYAEVFAFANPPTNRNPDVDGLSINLVGTDGGVTGENIDAGVADGGTDAGVIDAGTLDSCSVPEATRLGPSGCGNPNAFKQCQADRAEYQITLDVTDAVSELVDPSAMTEDGTGAVYELVWVDYFADQGDLSNSTVLIAAATGQGPGPYLQPRSSYSVNWIAPPAPEAGTLPVNIWAVVHDNRGGETVKQVVAQVSQAQ